MKVRHDLPSHTTANEHIEALATIPQPRPSRHPYWIQRALRGLPDFLNVVSLDGRIRYGSDSCKTAIGYEPDHLMGCGVNDFVRPDDLGVFARELNGVFVQGNSVRFIYRLWNSMNDRAILEPQCNAYQNGESYSTAGCRELIIMARPFINKSGIVFDSFLEHRFAYEVLVQQRIQLTETEGAADERSDGPRTRTVDGVSSTYSISMRKLLEQIVQYPLATLVSPSPKAIRPKEAH